MASTVGGHLLSQTEFDITLNLAPSTSAPAIHDYPVQHDGNAEYPLSTKTGTGFDSDAHGKTSQSLIDGHAISDPGSIPRISGGSVHTAVSKPRRVRTGCLTCRERHLKCDEALPRCQNCQKSDRLCKRGVRLNFIDTQVAAPPYAAPFAHNWQVSFLDESRDIASEYRGGFERYPLLRKEIMSKNNAPAYELPDLIGASTLTHQSLPNTAPLLTSFTEPSQPEVSDSIFHNNPASAPPNSSFPDNSVPHSPFGPVKSSLVSSSHVRPYLNTAEEVLFMQVFVEEVGLWMDSMDPMKHVRICSLHRPIKTQY